MVRSRGGIFDVYSIFISLKLFNLVKLLFSIAADREETSGLLSKQSQVVVSQNGPHDIDGSRQVTSVVTSSSDRMNTYREVKPGETGLILFSFMSKNVFVLA